MAAEYDFQRKPNPKGDGELQPMYPRIVNKGTITGKRLVSDISQATSFTPGDVEGVLAALESRISYYLSEGHHVQLGNMGYFSAGLTARPVMDKKEIHAQTIFFGKVHFRVSPGFRKQCAGFVERVRAGYGFRHSEGHQRCGTLPQTVRVFGCKSVHYAQGLQRNYGTFEEQGVE